MDPAQIIHALTHTLNHVKEQRVAAEAFLESAVAQPGFASGLLRIAATHELPHIRLAAAVQLKNSIRKHWVHIVDEDGAPPAGVNKPALSTDDKIFVKENIFEAAVGATTKSGRATLAEAISQISSFDFPGDWQSLLPQIQTALQGGDLTRTTHTLQVVRLLLKHFEFRSRERREPIEWLVNHLFPSIEPIFMQVVQVAGGGDPAQIEAAGNVARLIVKCVFSGSMFCMPEYFKHQANVLRWMKLMNDVAALDVEPFLVGMDDEDKNAYAWVKAKKWTMRYFHRLFSRFGNFKFCAKEDHAFCAIFNEHLSKTLMQTTMGIIALRVSGKFCSDRCMMYGLNYLTCCIEIGPTWVILRPQVTDIVLRVCMPVLYFNDNDFELWTDEPHEYIRKTYDPMEEYTDPRSAAISFILDLAKYRYKFAMPPVLQFCNQVLTNYNSIADSAQRPVREKEGVMGIIGALHETLTKKKDTKAVVEPLIIEHVLPEFQSPHGFMRARACWVMQQFAGSLTWHNKLAQLNSAQNVVQCLKDPELPVQVTAATALMYLIKDAEENGSDEEGSPDHPVIQVVKSVLPQILQAYFTMMNEIGVDEVIDALSTIISALSDDIEPYAIDIVTNLCSAFQRYVVANEASDDDESAVAAMNCLESVNVLLDALAALPEDKPQLFRTIEAHVLPIVTAILNPSGQGVDYLENSLQTVELFAFNGQSPFSPELWAIFPMIFNVYDKYAWDYIHDMISPLDSYITQDTDTFVSGGSNGVAYKEIILRIVQRYFENTASHASDVVAASRLYLSMLHNCHGKIDHVIPFILQGTLNRMRQPMEGPVSLAMLEIIESAFIYNAVVTLQFLVSQDALQFLLTLLMSQLQNHESKRQKKICVLGLLAILQINLDNLPDLIKQGYNQVLTKTVEMLHNLVKQNEEEPSDSDSDSSDSDDSDSDSSDGEDEDDKTSNDDGDGDAEVDDDEEYMKMLEELDAERTMNPDVWDQQAIEDHEDKYTSRLDDVSALATFVQTFQSLPESLIQTLHPQVQQAIPPLVQKAQEEERKRLEENAA